MVIGVEIEDIKHNLAYPLLVRIVILRLQIRKDVLKLSRNHSREQGDRKSNGEGGLLQGSEGLVHISADFISINKEVGGVGPGADHCLDYLGKHLDWIPHLEVEPNALYSVALQTDQHPRTRIEYLHEKKGNINNQAVGKNVRWLGSPYHPG
jgi:hypothetical protein